MQLVGKLDSPYVRRVAIALTLTDRPFAHVDMSVLRDFERFRTINPVVKAPTLILDDGTMLIESGLILDYLERTSPSKRSLQPDEPALYVAAQRMTGLALAACEKTVQLVYERQLRPAEKQYAPWTERVTKQLRAAYAALEGMIAADAFPLFGEGLTHADVIAAVAWRFTTDMVPGLVPAADHPRLAGFADRAEATPAFQATAPR